MRIDPKWVDAVIEGARNAVSLAASQLDMLVQHEGAADDLGHRAWASLSETRDRLMVQQGRIDRVINDREERRNDRGTDGTDRE